MNDSPGEVPEVGAFYAQRLKVLVDGIVALEAEPTLLGVSAHLLAIARKL